MLYLLASQWDGSQGTDNIYDSAELGYVGYVDDSIGAGDWW